MSVFIPIPKKTNAKECSNYCTTALISHANKVMLKILQARLQQYMNRELPDVQTGFRKAEKPEIKPPTSGGSLKKWENSRKTSTSALLTTPKPLTVWITTNCGNFWNWWQYETTWPASWETERVTGRKARGLQTEEICKCQTFLSLLSSRRKQTRDIFPSLYKFKGGFS